MLFDFFFESGKFPAAIENYFQKGKS